MPRLLRLINQWRPGIVVPQWDRLASLSRICGERQDRWRERRLSRVIARPYVSRELCALQRPGVAPIHAVFVPFVTVLAS